MRKIFIITAMTLLSTASFSQVKFGLKFAPTISANRVVDKLDESNVSLGKNGSGIRFNAGMFLDFHISDHVALSAGVGFASKRSSYEVDSSASGTDESPVFGLHYVQIPLAIKYYTEEIATDMKLYFSVGSSINLKVAEKIISEGDFEIDGDYAKIFDTSVIVGIGVELKIGSSNTLFAGLTYDRGLVNTTTKNHNAYSKKDLQINNDLFGLEMGIKF